jgi:hypothetical protein
MQRLAGYLRRWEKYSGMEPRYRERRYLIAESGPRRPVERPAVGKVVWRRELGKAVGPGNGESKVGTGASNENLQVWVLLARWVNCRESFGEMGKLGREIRKWNLFRVSQ